MAVPAPRPKKGDTFTRDGVEYRILRWHPASITTLVVPVEGNQPSRWMTQVAVYEAMGAYDK